MQVEKVLVSRREPASLSAVEWNLLRHCFGDDVILERTEVGHTDKVALFNLRHPVVLPMTMETKWGGLYLKRQTETNTDEEEAATPGPKKPVIPPKLVKTVRPEDPLIILMPDGFRMALVPA